MTKTAPTAIIGGDVMNGFGNLLSNSGGAPGGRGIGRWPLVGRGTGEGVAPDAGGGGAPIAVLVALEREVGAVGETSYDCPQPAQITGPATEPAEGC